MAPILKASAELEKLGQDLIAKHHPMLKILDIGYIFRDEAPKTDAHVLFGQAISVDARNWLFHRKDAIIQISEDIWTEMSDEFKTLLLDHELCHIGVELDDAGTVVMDEYSGRPKVKMIPHDIEEFYSIQKRYAPIYDQFREWAKKQATSRMSATKKKTLQALNP